jgi:hypothetical protein
MTEDYEEDTNQETGNQEVLIGIWLLQASAMGVYAL